MARNLLCQDIILYLEVNGFPCMMSKQIPRKINMSHQFGITRKTKQHHLKLSKKENLCKQEENLSYRKLKKLYQFQSLIQVN